MTSTQDVVIIGGGIIGSAAAYFLALRGARVRVIEADPSYVRASSALSASSIRQQFTSSVCMRMSRFGFDFLREAPTHLGLAGEQIDISLTQRGYLTLATQHDAVALDQALHLQLAENVPVRRLWPADLEREFSWMNSDDIALAALGVDGEGWFDGYSLLQAFRRKARVLGANYISEEAVGLDMTGNRVDAVRTRAGTYTCGAVINAAGFRAGTVAGWAGFDVPIAPERRCIFTFDCPSAPRDMPLIVDTSGVYVRPDGNGFLTGGPATDLRGAAAPCFDVDHAQFDEFIWPALAHRAPAFETLRLTGAWAGQYDMNLFDRNALIGWTPGVRNLAMAAGFSGHGLQHGPAAGLALCELLLDGGYSTIDVSDLNPQRLLEGRRLHEGAII